MSKIDCLNCKYYDFNACDGVDWCKLNHEETGVCGYCDREFEDLEEATTHYDALVEENNTFLMENSKMAREIKDLQSQLAEKEKEIEELHTQIEQIVKDYTSEIAFYTGTENQKAIEQLEKVKEWCENHKFSDEYDYVIAYEPDEEDASGCVDYLKEEIDNQIEELKKVMK